MSHVSVSLVSAPGRLLSRTRSHLLGQIRRLVFVFGGSGELRDLLVAVKRTANLQRVAEQSEGVVGILQPQLKVGDELQKRRNRTGRRAVLPVVDRGRRHPLFELQVVQVDDLRKLAGVEMHVIKGVVESLARAQVLH